MSTRSAIDLGRVPVPLHWGREPAPMYEDFYGLREKPFDLALNPRQLLLTAQHREALANLEHGIQSRIGITLLVGEAGTGKTTVIRSAFARA
ncbi:MAG: hypothetical protein ABIX28_01150, partial [Vicinamibacterales bacterium]